MKSKLIALLLASVMVISLTACNNGSKNEGNSKELSYTAGTYTAEKSGKNGPVKVEVIVSENAITSVKVIEHNETAGIAEAPVEKIPEKIVSGQTLSVDAMTGATITSDAILAAVEDCLTQAGADINALKEKSSQEVSTEVEEVTVDVVVVGAGASGTSAALAAVENANVLLLEKTAVPMGAGTLAGGMFAADSRLQKAEGTEVDKEWLYDQYLEMSGGYMNSILVRKIIDESGKTVDWLMDNGAELNLVDAGSGFAYVHQGMPKTLHGYNEGGTVAITKLIEQFESKGGEVRFSTPATELIKDDKGNVVGVIATKEDGSKLKVNADAVILATGGYGGNEEMLKENFGDDFTFGEVMSNTGEGIAMAWDAGADELGTETTQYFWETFTGEEFGALSEALGEDFFALTDFTMYPHLRVNKLGKRFSDETKVTNFAMHGAEIAMQPGAMEYAILDNKVLQQIAEKGYVSVEDHFGKWEGNRQFYMEFNENNDTDELHEKEITPTDYRPLLDEAVGTGVVVKADTIEDLAKELNVEASVLQASVDSYNKAVETGKDEQFFAELGHMSTLSDGPYYAVKYVARNLGTLGGVRINENIEAIDINGKAIPGLYVCGANAGGMYGKSYVDFEGGTLGFAYTSGRLAGINAAEYSKK